jgi:hypothetical protein
MGLHIVIQASKHVTYKQYNIYSILVRRLGAMFSLCVIKEYTTIICGRVKIAPID